MEDDLLEVGAVGFEGVENELEGEIECLGGGGTNDGGGGITKCEVEEWCLGGGGTTVKSAEVGCLVEGGGLTVWVTVDLFEVVLDLRGTEDGRVDG